VVTAKSQSDSSSWVPRARDPASSTFVTNGCSLTIEMARSTRVSMMGPEYLQREFRTQFLLWLRIFTTKSLDTADVSCIVRLGTMSVYMLINGKSHSSLTEAAAAAWTLECRNFPVDTTRQPGHGRALARRCAR
jgi:hypothetical protein